MRHTNHLGIRMTQRGLLRGVIDLTDAYGVDMNGRLGFRRTEGREVLDEMSYQLACLDHRSKEGRRQARRIQKVRNHATHMLSTGGCVLVYGDCGEVAITTYRYRSKAMHKRKGSKKH